eukprot:scaffold30879_cov32-Tisochrysis_lutea.AAC.4
MAMAPSVLAGVCSHCVANALMSKPPVHGAERGRQRVCVCVGGRCADVNGTPAGHSVHGNSGCRENAQPALISPDSAPRRAP